MRQKRKNILLIILTVILVPILGLKIYFEVDTVFYEKRIEQMKKNNELNIQIESSIEHKTLNMDDYEIHYFVSGKENNDPIVFLHPAFSDHRAFNQQIDFFSKDYRVITIDLIGHGLSKANKSKDKIDASSEHIKKILDIEGFDKAHLVGVSMGTYIAQYFALNYPEKVLSMTIVGGLDINVNNEEAEKAQRSEQVKWMVRALFSMNSFRGYVSKNVVSKLQEQARFYEMASLFKRKSFTVMSGLANILQERENITIDYPLLFLCGDKDIDLTKKISKEWHESEPSSEYCIIKNAGHCANMDNPKDFNRIVKEFIEKIINSRVN